MRMGHRFRTLGVIVCAGLLAVGSASAQSVDATTAAARARFQEGVELFDHGDFESARVAFLQALALKRHPAVLLNIAHCALRTNRPLEAKRNFESFLSESPNATPAQKDEARKGISDASLKVPHIVVDFASARRIVVDGVPTVVTGRGMPVELEVGTHRYTLEGDGGSVLRDGEHAFASAESFELRSAELVATTVLAVPVVPVVPGRPMPLQPEPAASRSSLFDEPEKMGPVYVGLGIGAAGTVGALVFLLAKNSATDNANATDAAIRSIPGGGRGACGSSGNPTQFGNLCSVLRENYDAIDKDALFGNISLGAAVAGTAFGAGWYLFSPKKAPSAESGLVLAPRLELLGSQKSFGVIGHF